MSPCHVGMNTLPSKTCPPAWTCPTCFFLLEAHGTHALPTTMLRGLHNWHARRKLLVDWDLHPVREQSDCSNDVLLGVNVSSDSHRFRCRSKSERNDIVCTEWRWKGYEDTSVLCVSVCWWPTCYGHACRALTKITSARYPTTGKQWRDIPEVHWNVHSESSVRLSFL